MPHNKCLLEWQNYMYTDLIIACVQLSVNLNAVGRGGGSIWLGDCGTCTCTPVYVYDRGGKRKWGGESEGGGWGWRGLFDIMHWHYSNKAQHSWIFILNSFTGCYSGCEGSEHPSCSAVQPPGLNQRHHMGTPLLLSHMHCWYVVLLLREVYRRPNLDGWVYFQTLSKSSAEYNSASQIFRHTSTQLG